MTLDWKEREGSPPAELFHLFSDPVLFRQLGAPLREKQVMDKKRL